MRLLALFIAFSLFAAAAEAAYFERGKRVAGKRFTANGTMHCPGANGRLNMRRYCGIALVGDRQTVVPAQHCFVYRAKELNKAFMRKRVKTLRLVTKAQPKRSRAVANRLTALRRDYLRANARPRTRRGKVRAALCRARFFTVTGKSVWRDIDPGSLVFGSQRQQIESYSYTGLPFDIEGMALPFRASGHNRHHDWAVGRLSKPVPARIQPLRMPEQGLRFNDDVLVAARGDGYGRGRRRLYGGIKIAIQPLSKTPALAERWRGNIGYAFLNTVAVVRISAAPGFSGSALSSGIAGQPVRAAGVFRGMIVALGPYPDKKSRDRCRNSPGFKRVQERSDACSAVVLLPTGAFLKQIRATLNGGR